MPGQRKKYVDQDEMVYSQFLFTSSSAIALPFDTSSSSSFKIIEEL
ncbi:hypothetical protein [Salegentibacter sp. Hel_I_6]|nr:hypothetical protein [Salegentibacter sp. Hel_I_6]